MLGPLLFLQSASFITLKINYLLKYARFNNNNQCSLFMILIIKTFPKIGNGPHENYGAMVTS